MIRLAPLLARLVVVIFGLEPTATVTDELVRARPLTNNGWLTADKSRAALFTFSEELLEIDPEPLKANTPLLAMVLPL